MDAKDYRRVQAEWHEEHLHDQEPENLAAFLWTERRRHLSAVQSIDRRLDELAKQHDANAEQ